MELLRVQHIIATLERGGAENQIAALTTNLDPEQFQVEVLCLTRGGPHAATISAAGVPVRVIGKPSRYSSSGITRLVSEIRRFRPHIVHTWMFTSNAFGRVAATIGRVPIRIASERSSVGLDGLYAATDRLLAPLTDCIIGNSEPVRELVLERTGIHRDRTRVIHNGLDTSRFRPVTRDRPAGARPVIMSVGRLVPAKRHDVLIDAIGLLTDQGIDVELRIVGGGDERSALEERIARLGLESHVHLLGERSDVPALLEEADIFAMASDREGMPNAMLEAMATGLPAVGTRVGGVPEVIVEGETGFVVPRRSPPDLARALTTLIESPDTRARLGDAGARRAASDFSVPMMVARYEDLYRELARRKGLR